MSDYVTSESKFVLENILKSLFNHINSERYI